MTKAQRTYLMSAIVWLFVAAIEFIVAVSTNSVLFAIAGGIFFVVGIIYASQFIKED